MLTLRNREEKGKLRSRQMCQGCPPIEVLRFDFRFQVDNISNLGLAKPRVKTGKGQTSPNNRIVGLRRKGKKTNCNEIHDHPRHEI